MNRIINYSILLGMICLALSCTKNFDEKNTNPNAINEITPAELPYLFTQAEMHSVFGGSYQTAQNLSADQYAQYFACVATSFPSDRYVMRSDWWNAAWTSIYTNMAPQLLTLFEKTEPGSAEYALANVIWVLGFHRLTDYWGPIPYFKVGAVANQVPYDAQDKIYDDFFKRLDSAVQVLKTREGSTPFGGSDIIYGGDVSKWIKLANTLRLRLAMRIARVNPAKARIEGEAAYKAGVFTTSPDDDALLQRTANDVNGLSRMSDWNEFRMSATMESVLKGYTDPRMEVYFLPAVSSKTYEGLRNGLTANQMTEAVNTPKATSHVGARWSSPASQGVDDYLSTPQNVMCAAEAYFLRSEGALLGWNMGGQAKELYEQGIRASMTQWGIDDEALVNKYINGNSTPVAPNDYLKSPAVTDVPVAFAGDQAKQLQQIAIQKWLALFPDGCEAWADNRRSRAFKLYPVANSDNPDIANPATQYIRRLTFTTQEQQTNASGVLGGVELLGGADKISTPLWWDKNR